LLNTLLGLLLNVGCSRLGDPLPGFPNLILWAWERPEDLRFIVPSATGVAFLAGTISLENGECFYKPRMQPMRVPPDTRLIAVVRIESHGGIERVAVSQVTDQVLHCVADPRIGALQIDFDARVSERPFYGALLAGIRNRLPRQMPLEMTALVSWCASDDWLSKLPVAESVPMFFRMGADAHQVSERLHEPLCKSSIGISTDEVYTEIPRGRRMFVFHPRTWTESDYRAVLQESKKWR